MIDNQKRFSIYGHALVHVVEANGQQLKANSQWFVNRKSPIVPAKQDRSLLNILIEE